MLALCSVLLCRFWTIDLGMRLSTWPIILRIKTVGTHILFRVVVIIVIVIKVVLILVVFILKLAIIQIVAKLLELQSFPSEPVDGARDELLFDVLTKGLVKL